MCFSREMKMKYSTVFVILMLLPVNAQNWKCPSPGAKDACASYGESKDSKKPLQKGEFVCFREAKDEYFTIGAAHTWVTSDKKEEQPGIITAWVTDHGVENETMQPNAVIFGKWHRDGDFVYFDFDKSKYTNHSVLVDEDTFDLETKYQNIKHEQMSYSLAIDASTGRYIESWQSSPDFFDKQYGRCIVGKD